MSLIYPGKLSNYCDLLPDVDQVENQGSIGSCTANAATSGLEIIYHRAGQHVQLSRLYLYYCERAMANALHLEGAMPSNMVATLQTKGCCLESSWPYDTSKSNVQPPVELDDEAGMFKIQDFDWPQYMGPRSSTWIRNCVASGSPVLMSFLVNQDFMDRAGTYKDWTKTIWDQSPNSNTVGYHEVAIIGWSDKCSDGLTRFLCQNSWGADWGDGGFFGIPAGCLSLANSMYAITKCNVPLKGVPGMTPQEVLDAYAAITGVPSADDPGVKYWAEQPGATKKDLWYAMMVKCQEQLSK